MEDLQKLLLERFQILGISSFIFLLFFLFALKNGYFTFPRSHEQEAKKLPGRVFFLGFAIFLILQLLIIPLTLGFWIYFYTLGETDQISSISPELQGWANVYSIFVCAVGLFLYFRSLSKTNKDIALGPYAHNGWVAKIQDFSVACFTWILSYPLVIAVGQIVAILLLVSYQNVEPEQVAVKQIKNASTSTFLLGTLIFCVIFVVPVIEELLFRGFLQNWLKKFVNRYRAVMVTSLIFALFHFSITQGMGNIELVISLFVLSCFLGYIYERQQSLWAPISLHALFNAISIMLIFYVDTENNSSLSLW